MKLTEYVYDGKLNKPANFQVDFTVVDVTMPKNRARFDSGTTKSIFNLGIP